MSQSNQEKVLLNVTLCNLTPPILSVIANHCLVMRVCETLLLGGQRVRNGGEGEKRHWLCQMAANHLGLKCLLRRLEDESPVCPELMGSNVATGTGGRGRVHRVLVCVLERRRRRRRRGGGAAARFPVSTSLRLKRFHDHPSLSFVSSFFFIISRELIKVLPLKESCYQILLFTWSLAAWFIHSFWKASLPSHDTQSAA